MHVIPLINQPAGNIMAVITFVSDDIAVPVASKTKNVALTNANTFLQSAYTIARLWQLVTWYIISFRECSC